MCNECQNAIKGMKRRTRKNKVNMELLAGVSAGGFGGMLVEKVTEKVPALQAQPMILPIVKGAAGAYLAIYTKSNFTKGLGYGLITVSAMELAEANGLYGLTRPRRGMSALAHHNRQAGVLGHGHMQNGMYMGKAPVQSAALI